MNRLLLLLLAIVPCSWLAAAPVLPGFDFTQAAVCAEWRAAHHIAGLRSTAEGLEISINGSDPYFHGPLRDYPAGLPLWLALRVKSEQGGAGQVFYYRSQPSEESSVHFSVKPGEWTDVRVTVPALGPGIRLRIDPPGAGGRTVIASLRFESAAPLVAPAWPKPLPLDLAGAARLQSEGLGMEIAARGFRVTVGRMPMAVSHTRSLLGYVIGEELHWVELSGAAVVERNAGTIKTLLTVKDQDGATWKLARTFSVGGAGVIDVETTVEADRERAVAFLPLLLLSAGEGSTNKAQALFPGLEYLDNEPSSSEADLIGPESKRQVPANHKITFPLMTVLKDGRYVGLIWDHTPQVSALFDSPDRLLGTGGHLMGVLFPGSDGYNRHEGDLMPMRPEVLRAGQRLVLKAQIIGGTAASMVPAIQQYVKLRGLPPVPNSGYSFQNYVSLAVHGWLDSQCRHTNFFRHAVWQGFGPQPAADAALHLRWLATRTDDAALRQRMTELEHSALASVPPAQWDSAAVGHIRYPVQSLVYGHVAENAAHHHRHAKDLLSRFNADGTVTYHPGKTDYGRTHFTNHANGLTFQVAATMLEAAAVSGDPALITQALTTIRAMQRAYANTVPRGAQTWEVPLHTPDNMASAHGVHVFTLAYQLTGERAFLDEAVYWAWTGLPFFYLINPTGTPDPPYGCVTVYGATSWAAPVWMGRPVQWCGLVYADALYRLAPHDPRGPWKQIADGITAMGLRFTWPREDKERQGLLPDVWEMLSQTRSGPAINPATVQVNALRLYDQPALYDFHVFRLNGQRLAVHAPGAIVPAAQTETTRAKFTVRGWSQEPYYVLFSGLARAPQVTINGQPAPLAEPHQFQEKEGRLILKLSGQPMVEVGL